MRLPSYLEETMGLGMALAVGLIITCQTLFRSAVAIVFGCLAVRGTSEAFVGRVLKDGYREKVRLTSDFYLLHGLNNERWSKMKELRVTEWAEKKIGEGKIKYLGFSFHDEYCLFKEIIDSYDGWTFCQIQYNYIDTEY